MNVKNLIDPQLSLSEKDKRNAESLPPRLDPPHSVGLAPAPQLLILRNLERVEYKEHDNLLPQIGTSNPVVPTATVASLLGPDAAIFPMTESTFREAIKLRTEQEKTRQEQIRLEVASRNLAIMEHATRNEVPPHLIPYLVVGDPSDPRQIMSPQKSAAVPMVPVRAVSVSGSTPLVAPESVTLPSAAAMPPVFAPYYPQASPYAGSGQSPAGRAYENPDNASLVAPMNFRFGMGAKFAPESPQRTQSPAKIGAAAVANLANPVTPYRQTYRTLPSHQRHFSMPADPGVLTLRPGDRTKAKVSQPSRLRSPQGSTPAIQVKPSPAQPLNKQTKNSQIPSQESMTSFQHIIQFHHWKPQNPGDPPMPDKPPGPPPDVPLGQYTTEPLGHSRSSSRAAMTHKRHKSSDMSVDLLSQANPYFSAPVYGVAPVGPSYRLNEAPEEDVSMEISDVSNSDMKLLEERWPKKKPGRPRRNRE